MGQGQSWGEAARGWIERHAWVDFGLQVVTLALFLLILLVAVSGCIYWFWWLVRLLRPRNIGIFTKQAIPGLRRGKAGGVELEFGGAAALAERDLLQAVGYTVEELSSRLATAEATVKKLEQAFADFEDVSGRA